MPEIVLCHVDSRTGKRSAGRLEYKNGKDLCRKLISMGVRSLSLRNCTVDDLKKRRVGNVEKTEIPINVGKLCELVIPSSDSNEQEKVWRPNSYHLPMMVKAINKLPKI